MLNEEALSRWLRGLDGKLVCRLRRYTYGEAMGSHAQSVSGWARVGKSVASLSLRLHVQRRSAQRLTLLLAALSLAGTGVITDLG